MRERRTTIPLAGILLAVAAWIAAPGLAGAEDKNPYLRADGTWISISGEVKNVNPDTFTLDYGDGMITVEMDDGDRDADAYKLLEGDEVTVNGRIDDDFYQTTTIEASSVYVEKLGTHFFASSIDEEDRLTSFVTVPIASETIVRGTVTKVNDSEFTVDTGLRELRVDVTSLGFDPLDDEGYLRIRTGDYVRVSGDLESSFFEGRELEAESIVKLSG